MSRLCLWLAAIAATLLAQPYSWLPSERRLDISGAGDRFEVLCHGSHDPCDIGVRFDALKRIDALDVSYAVVTGSAYEPAPTGQRLERWDANAWRAVPAFVTIDYSRAGEAGPAQRSGISRWRYRFAPIETTRIRVFLTRPRNPDAWHRAYAVNQIAATFTGEKFEKPGLRISGSVPDAPPWLDAGANLAVAEAGARIQAGMTATVEWPRRLMASRVEWTPAQSAWVEWWDGAAWRAIEPGAAPTPGGTSFLPVSTTGLRVQGASRPVRSIRAYLDARAADYTREVQQSRFDLLGERFRALHRPDLNAMRSLLLPLDFAQVAIGRPADLEETHVTWNGTFFMVEEGGGQDWDHGAQKRPPRAERHDRWFAFAAGEAPETPGEDWMTTSTSYLDGWLPATITKWQEAVEYRQTLFVTAPGDPVYGTVAEIRALNTDRRPRQARIMLAMGRRRHAQAMGPERNPLAFWPERTGYRLERGGRAVVTANGDVVVFAGTPGEWTGTDRENQLRYTLRLAPGESRTLRFLAPSVTQPVAAPNLPAHYDWDRSLARFRDFWNRTLASGAEFDLPDPDLNRIYRNLLAQCLIIAMDGENQVKYGSYSYESYFGIEEGWPAIALAQYGHHRDAQQMLSAMLSPRLMDKSNYHHQYRNGLEPWYAVTAYRMSHDRAWLESIAPALEAAAEWTIRVIHENRDPKYPGILPRHAYGGDIHTPAYSFYSNATCWRGLHDTAAAFRVLGRVERATRYEREADAYRKRLIELADSLADRRATPTFLPMSFDIGDESEHRDKEPAYDFLATTYPPSYTWGYLSNFWNLFAPMLLEVKLFDAGDSRSEWIPAYMEARGGIAAGLARFTIGLDQIYGKGYYENLLEHGHRERFLTSLYAVLAHGMSQNLNSFPEVAGIFPLRFDNSSMWKEHQRTKWDWGFPGAEQTEGQPLSAGPGMALQLLRMALVRETMESDRQDVLRIFDGAPREWFEPGKRIRISRAATMFGPVSADCTASAQRIVAHVSTAAESDARQIVVRLPSPARRPIRAVMVNAERWRDFSAEEVRLPGRGRFEISVDY